MTVTRWWWVRHAPVVGQDGRIYGNRDVACDCSDETVFRGLARLLPQEAAWVVTPLSRTVKTAEAIHRQRTPPQPPFAVEADLAEQDFGHWQSMTYAELDAQRSADWRRFWLGPAEEVPPGGESFASVCRRVGTAVSRLTQRFAGGDVVCVSHGGPIRAALGHALGLTPDRALSFAIDNCAVTRLDHFAEDGRAGLEEGQREGKMGETTGPGGSWRVAAVNVKAHMPERP